MERNRRERKKAAEAVHHPCKQMECRCARVKKNERRCKCLEIFVLAGNAVSIRSTFKAEKSGRKMDCARLPVP